MKRSWKAALAALGAAAAIGIGAAVAQNPSQLFVLGNGDLIPAIVGGVGGQPSTYISAVNLAGYAGSLPTKANYLIGGDATTNLWQRCTAGTATTTTATYGCADRFFIWSGTGTEVKLIRSSTAADLPAGYQYAFKLQRTSGQTGVVQSCVAQEIESVNSYPLAGQTVEVDFHAAPGANFSAASSKVTVYVITGTGSDEGSVDLAFGLNAGGGGSSGWTGQANATAAVISLFSGMGRYAAVATIPAGTTEVGVALCDKPVGTAGTNDYVAFDGLQLVRNPALTANATKGYNCSQSTGGSTQQAANAGTVQCTAFDRSRGNAVEAMLQYRYYWQLSEITGPAGVAPCRAHSTTVAECQVAFPVTMRVAPTMTYAAGFSTETTTAGGTLGACSALATASTVTSTAPSAQGVQVACTATTVPAAGSADILWANGGSGAIKASAEL